MFTDHLLLKNQRETGNGNVFCAVVSNYRNRSANEIGWIIHRDFEVVDFSKNLENRKDQLTKDCKLTFKTITK